MGELLSNLKDLFEDKKILFIALGALLGILIIVVAVALILRGRGGERYENADAPYPYSWVETKKGSIQLTLERGKASNGAWSLESTEGDAVDIEVGKPGRKTKVTLTPTEEGRESMAFALMSGEEQLAELNVTVTVERVNEELFATVSSHRERAVQGTVRGGEETGHPFTVRGSEDGLTIFVEDSEGYTVDDGLFWASESTDGMVASVASITTADGGVMIQLQTRANGTAEVRAYSESRNISFVFDVEVVDGEMMLVDSRTEPYETAEETAETAESEAQS